VREDGGVGNCFAMHSLCTSPPHVRSQRNSRRPILFKNKQGADKVKIQTAHGVTSEGWRVGVVEHFVRIIVCSVEPLFDNL